MRAVVRPARFHYYLYDNVEKRFIRIHDGFLCGRVQGDLKFAIDDDVISRKQCRFHIEANDVYIEDLGATNKTKVNTVAIAPNKRRRIQLNDVIEFGRRRFILTNQNKHEPSNFEDIRSKQIFKAARNDDGSLTSQISRIITKQTRVLMDRRTYRRLRVSEFARLRGWDSSTRLVLGSIVALWISAAWFLARSGAFAPGLPNSSWLLGGKIFLATLTCTSIFTLWHYLAIRRRYPRAIKRLAFVPVWILAALTSVPIIEAGTSLLTDATQNLVELHCLRSFSQEACRPWASAESLGFKRLPREQQEAILAKLKR